MLRFASLVAAPILFAVTISPAAAAAQAGDGLPSECALAKANDFTTAREAQGFDGIVTADLIEEFEAQCEMEGKGASAPALAPDRAIASANRPIHEAAADGRNLFALPEVRRLYLGLFPEGSSGIANPVSEGTYRSATDGRLALTLVCEDSAQTSLCLAHSAVIIDLADTSAIACQRLTPPGESPSVWWSFGAADIHEDPDGRWCPDTIAEIPPSVLAYWLPGDFAEAPAGEVAAAAHFAPEAIIPMDVSLFDLPDVRDLYIRDYFPGTAAQDIHIPIGDFQSERDERIALTRVCETTDQGCPVHVTLLVNMQTEETAVCQRMIENGRAVVIWLPGQGNAPYFAEQWCPARVADVPAEILARWQYTGPATSPGAYASAPVKK